MKRECSDPKKDNNNNPAMFSDLHRHLLQPYSTSSSSPPIHFHQHQHQNPFPFTVDDASSSGGGGGGASTRALTITTPKVTRQKIDSDGASIEVQRRPRGRPPGSKNKPKPPVVITRELPDPIMSPYILEISNSADVIDSVAKFSRRRNTCLCILQASGAVANVTIRQPTPNSSSTVTFHGRFDILSLDATFLSQTMPGSCIENNPNVGVLLSIPQGQIIGGIVAGPLIAAGTVYVIAASFSNPSFQRLPVHEEDDENVNNISTNNQTTSSGGNDGQSPSAGDNNDGGGGGGGMYSSSCNNNIGCSDVIWAPAARQPF